MPRRQSSAWVWSVCDPEDLLEGGLPEDDLADAVLAEGPHAGRLGLGGDGPAVCPLHDETPDGVVDLEKLIDSGSPRVAGAGAVGASGALIYLGRGKFHVLAQGVDHRLEEALGQVPEHLAVGADLPDEPLGHDRK